MRPARGSAGLTRCSVGSRDASVTAAPGRSEVRLGIVRLKGAQQAVSDRDRVLRRGLRRDDVSRRHRARGSGRDAQDDVVSQSKVLLERERLEVDDPHVTASCTSDTERRADARVSATGTYRATKSATVRGVDAGEGKPVDVAVRTCPAARVRSCFVFPAERTRDLVERARTRGWRYWSSKRAWRRRVDDRSPGCALT